METLETNVKQLEARLELWTARLDGLVVKAERASAEASGKVKASYRKHLDDLKAQHQAAQAKLDEIRAAGEDQWAGLKPGAERIWDALEIAFNKLDFLN